MRPAIFSLVACAATAWATQGFNYGSLKKDGSIMAQSDFQSDFSTAKALSGTNGAFSSARLYTTIQGGSTNTPISAIPAAIAEGTTLLLGMWASSGQTTIDNEIAALKSAISTYRTAFTSLVVGLSVGSEDLYRITPTGLANDPNSVGAGPDVLVSYINQVRSALKGTDLENVKIGHVDTWTGWVNGSNSAVVDACDFLGMNTFPYYQTTDSNGIANGKSLFQAAYDATTGAAKGKPVWVTETGWPVAGKQSGQATASVDNAKAYWDSVGCSLFGKTNTWWYTLVDGNTDPTQPSFGIVGTTLSSTPLYDLSCASAASSPSSAAAPPPSSSQVSQAVKPSTQAPSPSPTPSPAASPASAAESAPSPASNAIPSSSSSNTPLPQATSPSPTPSSSSSPTTSEDLSKTLTLIDNPSPQPSPSASTSTSSSSTTPSGTSSSNTATSANGSPNASPSVVTSTTTASRSSTASSTAGSSTTAAGTSGGSSTSSSTSSSSSAKSNAAAGLAVGSGSVLGGLAGAVIAVLALF